MSRTPLGTCLMYRPFLVLLFLVLLTPAGCRDGLDFRVVEVVMEDVDADDFWFMTTDSWWLFFAPMEDGGSSWIPLGRGAEVFMEAGDFEGFLPVFPSDGDRLVFGGGDYMLSLGGVPVALSLLTDDDRGWDWLAGATPEEKTELRSLFVESPVTPEHFVLLEELALRNSQIEVAAYDGGLMMSLLGLFDPVFSPVLEEMVMAENIPLLVQEPKLRTVLVENPGLTALGFLRQLPRLETLFISEWDPDEAGPLPDSIHGLTSIVLIDWDGEDLKDLGKQPGLEKLTLVGCDGDHLTDLSALAAYPKLHLLAFRGCEVAELGPLAALKNLRWLGLPDETTQSQLEQIALALPELEFLELLVPDDVTDLAPLTQMKNLRGLILETEAPPDPLFEMDQLEYLALSIDSDEESPYGEHIIPRLRAELPETVLARVEGFCLGSGYILLLFPMVGLIWVFLGRRRRGRV